MNVDYFNNTLIIKTSLLAGFYGKETQVKMVSFEE